MKESLLRLLGQKTYVPANVPELLHHLCLRPDRQQELQKVLGELLQAGLVVRTKGNRYILPGEADLIPGRILMNRSGKGFLAPDDKSLKEIAIPESATGTALHEDRVLVRRDVRGRPGRAGTEVQDTGTVIRILERHRAQMVGTLQRSERFLYVIPDDPRVPHDIYVPEPRDVGRKPNVGDKVVVELREWESRHTNPEGEVIEVLGPPDAEGVDMLSVLRQYNLPLHFPQNVLQEARAIGNEVRSEEIAGREDCRAHRVITIDPDDAKDFDDAICVERADGGHWKVWVHIADVSHYVKPGTALDDEARRRGNSTYLVDRVMPMLPEALSNELCSLKPHVDRLTKCVEFLVSNDGRVVKSRFFPAVIHSQRRFTYREAFAVLQRAPDGAIEQMLHDANALAQRIRRLRFQAGALEMDFPEMKIRLDERGKVERIERVENDISHQLIEEFMLLANEAVAARLLQTRRPAIHRVHEEPDPRRLQEYRDDVLSHHLACGNLSHRGEVQKLLHRLGTVSIGAALKIGFLRSLKRARYAVEPLGHYGLAKKHYAHFTSPIRRYADLVVHRALFEQSHGPKHSLHETAEHISMTERNSADAERDSKDVKMYAYLESQLGSGQPQRYPALVTELRNFGFFVDVTGLGMSGLVPLSTVEDDFFMFDPARNQLVGRRTRRVIKLGDLVEVQIAKVDRYKKQVDFRLAQTQQGRSPQQRQSGRPAPGRRLPGREQRSSRPPQQTRRDAARPHRGGSRPPLRSSQSDATRRQQGGARRPLPASQSGAPRREQQGASRPTLPTSHSGSPRRDERSRPPQKPQGGQSSGKTLMQSSSSGRSIPTAQRTFLSSAQGAKQTRRDGPRRPSQGGRSQGGRGGRR